MIDTSQKIRSIVNENPQFGEFLKEKGFPLNLNNPVTLVVSFDDIVKMKHLDKEALMAEYQAWEKKG